MKSPSLLTLGGLSLVVASCGTIKNIQQPLSSDGDFDPLRSPASASSSSSSSRKKSSAVVAPTSPSYKPGQWVETSMSNATFFRSIPKGNARADKVLSVGTPLKVVSNKGTYVKVELDSGDVGYVPEIMVIERGDQSTTTTSSPVAPVPDLGSVPPPVDPADVSGSVPPPPTVPSIPPPVPEVPSLPKVPTLPDAPPVPSGSIPPIVEPTVNDLPTVPSVPDIAPPPEIPGITDPVPIE